MRLTRKQIDEVFAKAKQPHEYLLELYKLVYRKDWDKVKQVVEFPKTSEETWKYIANKAIKFDKKHSSGFPGGLWLNNGFSVDSNLTGFRVIAGKVKFG